MKVMVMIKVNGADEDKIVPMPEMTAAMGAYDERLVKAGIMLDGGGLRPSSAGAQVVFEEGTTSVVGGPFTESKEIVAGYWVWQVTSPEEAVEWARQCPIGPGSGMRDAGGPGGAPVPREGGLRGPGNAGLRGPPEPKERR